MKSNSFLYSFFLVATLLFTSFRLNACIIDDIRTKMFELEIPKSLIDSWTSIQKQAQEIEAKTLAEVLRLPYPNTKPILEWINTYLDEVNEFTRNKFSTRKTFLIQKTLNKIITLDIQKEVSYGELLSAVYLGSLAIYTKYADDQNTWGLLKKFDKMSFPFSETILEQVLFFKPEFSTKKLGLQMPQQLLMPIDPNVKVDILLRLHMRLFWSSPWQLTLDNWTNPGSLSKPLSKQEYLSMEGFDPYLDRNLFDTHIFSRYISEKMSLQRMIFKTIYERQLTARIWKDVNHMSNALVRADDQTIKWVEHLEDPAKLYGIILDQLRFEVNRLQALEGQPTDFVQRVNQIYYYLTTHESRTKRILTRDYLVAPIPPHPHFMHMFLSNILSKEKRKKNAKISPVP